MQDDRPCRPAPYPLPPACLKCGAHPSHRLGCQVRASQPAEPQCRGPSPCPHLQPCCFVVLVSPLAYWALCGGGTCPVGFTLLSATKYPGKEALLLCLRASPKGRGASWRALSVACSWPLQPHRHAAQEHLAAAGSEVQWPLACQVHTEAAFESLSLHWPLCWSWCQ